MLPFDSYAGGGRQLLGVRKGNNTRREDAPEFMRLVSQKRCAYCGLNFTATLENWLTVVLDHVVPINLCKSTQIPETWTWDYSNAVLACGACNGFCNRYSPSFKGVPPDTLRLSIVFGTRFSQNARKRLQQAVK